MGDTRTFRRKVHADKLQGGIVHSIAGEPSRDYFIKLFPERRKAIEMWSDSFADDARKSATEAILESTKAMELAYNVHEAFMQGQYKEYGSCAITAELEHIQNVDKAVKGDGTLDKLYGKLVNEATREAIVRRVFT